MGEGAGDEVILAVTAAQEKPGMRLSPQLSEDDKAIPLTRLEDSPTSPPGMGERWVWLALRSAMGDGQQNLSPIPGGEVGTASVPGEGASAYSSVEVHCHGGLRVVRWIIEQFVALGCVESVARSRDAPADLLPYAPTLRTASILLDHTHGAFDKAVHEILDQLGTDPTAAVRSLAELASFAPVGRHLVLPWKVVIAGAPNVGKSSLANALAGYQRAVVSEIAGTTRDVVSVQVAFDGWPVELIDTAGLRDAAGLEAEGIELAKRTLAEADLVVWVMDATASTMNWPTDDIPAAKLMTIVNKADAMVVKPEGLQLVSATTGSGIPELVAAITQCLVPVPPQPGAAVPYTPQLAQAVEATQAALSGGRTDEAIRLLRSLAGPR
jgi:tRNA modification GTPase